jgi:hypothetical protein
LQGIAAHRPAAAGDEQRGSRGAAAFGKPGSQGDDGGGGQGRDPVLAALAVAGDVGADDEMDVAAGQGDELGGPQPGLGREQDPGVVAAAGAGGPVWC